jgi:hypothetical protein
VSKVTLFKPQVGNVEIGQITGGFTVIIPFFNVIQFFYLLIYGVLIFFFFFFFFFFSHFHLANLYNN